MSWSRNRVCQKWISKPYGRGTAIPTAWGLNSPLSALKIAFYLLTRHGVKCNKFLPSEIKEIFKNPTKRVFRESSVLSSNPQLNAIQSEPAIILSVWRPVTAREKITIT